MAASPQPLDRENALIPHSCGRQPRGSCGLRRPTPGGRPAPASVRSPCPAAPRSRSRSGQCSTFLTVGADCGNPTAQKVPRPRELRRRFGWRRSSSRSPSGVRRCSAVQWSLYSPSRAAPAASVLSSRLSCRTVLSAASSSSSFPGSPTCRGRQGHAVMVNVVRMFIQHWVKFSNIPHEM